MGIAVTGPQPGPGLDNALRCAPDPPLLTCPGHRPGRASGWPDGAHGPAKARNPRQGEGGGMDVDGLTLRSGRRLDARRGSERSERRTPSPRLNLGCG